MSHAPYLPFDEPLRPPRPVPAPVKFDVCERKHGGVETSVAANLRTNKAAGQKMILDYLKSHKDGTLREVCKANGKAPNEISGRFTDLKIAKAIRRTGERRDGCYVWELVK